MELLLIILIIMLPIGAYILTLRKYHEIHLPTLNLGDLIPAGKKKSNVLFVYPHPDDETVFSGGLLRKLSHSKYFNVHVVSTTQGEAGDEILKLPKDELGQVRQLEFKNVMELLGKGKIVSKMWDFKDSNVKSEYETLRDRIHAYIKQFDIDLVVTYERTGMYGHQDHVAVTKAVNEIHQTFGGFKTLFTTLPAKIEKRHNIKSKITGLELDDFDLNEQPEVKLPIFTDGFARYKAMKLYKSQRLNHTAPLLVQMLFNTYEYYTTKYESRGPVTRDQGSKKL